MGQKRTVSGAMKAMDGRTAVETTLERFLAMEAEHHRFFTAFDVAYKCCSCLVSMAFRHSKYDS